MGRRQASRRRSISARRTLLLEPLERREAVSSLVDLAMTRPAEAVGVVPIVSKPSVQGPRRRSPRDEGAVAMVPQIRSQHDELPVVMVGLAADLIDHSSAPAAASPARQAWPDGGGDWLILDDMGEVGAKPTAPAQPARSIPAPSGSGIASGSTVLAGPASAAATPLVGRGAIASHNSGSAAGVAPSGISAGTSPPPAPGSGGAAITPLFVASSAPAMAPTAEAADSNDPIIEYNHSGGSESDTGFTDVIGDGVGVYVEPPPGSGLTINTVSWSVTNAYAAQGLSNRNGFTNPPLDASQDHDAFIGFFWDQTGGSRTITANVTYVDAMGNDAGGGSASLTGTVVVPVGNITAIYGTPGIGTRTDPNTGQTTGQWLQYDASDPVTTGSYGIGWKATIDPATTAEKGGTFGVIQTITDANIERKRQEWSYFSQSYTSYVEDLFVSLPDKQYPRPVLDDFFSANTMVYYNDATGTVPADPMAAATSIAQVDSPGVQLVLPWTNYDLNEQFKMTLMYEAPGGIKVPIGSLNWGWSAAAHYNSTTGAFALDFTPTKSSTAYTATTAYPTWVESGSVLAQNGDNGWVQVAP